MCVFLWNGHLWNFHSVVLYLSPVHSLLCVMFRQCIEDFLEDYVFKKHCTQFWNWTLRLHIHDISLPAFQYWPWLSFHSFFVLYCWLCLLHCQTRTGCDWPKFWQLWKLIGLGFQLLYVQFNVINNLQPPFLYVGSPQKGGDGSHLWKKKSFNFLIIQTMFKNKQAWLALVSSSVDF